MNWLSSFAVFLGSQAQDQYCLMILLKRIVVQDSQQQQQQQQQHSLFSQASAVQDSQI